MAAAFTHTFDLGAGTAAVTLLVDGSPVTSWSYDNAAQEITFGAQAAPATITQTELALLAEALRVWMGVLFKAWRPSDTALLPFERATVVAADSVDLDDATDGNVTIDASFNRATRQLSLGVHSAATMAWRDLWSWFTLFETFVQTCAENP